MSIIVRAWWKYWNDGLCQGGGLLEYPSVKDAIEDLGTIAWHNADKEEIEVEQTIPAGHVGEIAEGIQQYVKVKRHEFKLNRARQYWQSHVDWLTNVDDEIKERSQRVRELEAEIAELEANAP